MTRPVLAYRWSQSEFVRASEAGAFDRRVELIEGEIWPLVIGSWHGDTAGQLVALMPRPGVRDATANTGKLLAACKGKGFATCGTRSDPVPGASAS